MGRANRQIHCIELQMCSERSFWKVDLCEVLTVLMKDAALDINQRQVYKMRTFTKILLASLCVAYIAVKWTAPSFNAGKRDATLFFSPGFHFAACVPPAHTTQVSNATQSDFLNLLLCTEILQMQNEARLFVSAALSIYCRHKVTLSCTCLRVFCNFVKLLTCNLCMWE